LAPDADSIGHDLIDNSLILCNLHPSLTSFLSANESRPMGAALDVVQQGYAAFGSKDIPTLLKLVADQVDWKEICPASLPYSGLRRTPSEVGEFFSAITKVEDVTRFEPQEFIEAGDSVTVLGYLEAFALDTKQKFQTEWVHVFTVRDGKITRWRGFTNSAARYGH
jgi:uncharacterized protein